MSLQAVTTDLQTKIKSGLSAYANRVYVMSSRVAFLYANFHDTPAVSIVYLGSSGNGEKGDYRSTETHRFEINIFQDIWTEEEVVSKATTGLLALQDAMVALLEGSLTVFTGRVIDITVTERLGTQDYEQGTNGKYRASIGLNVSILEEIV